MVFSALQLRSSSGALPATHTTGSSVPGGRAVTAGTWRVSAPRHSTVKRWQNCKKEKDHWNSDRVPEEHEVLRFQGHGVQSQTTQVYCLRCPARGSGSTPTRPPRHQPHSPPQTIQAFTPGSNLLCSRPTPGPAEQGTRGTGSRLRLAPATNRAAYFTQNFTVYTGPHGLIVLTRASWLSRIHVIIPKRKLRFKEVKLLT